MFFKPQNWCQTDFVFENPYQIRLFAGTALLPKSGANFFEEFYDESNLKITFCSDVLSKTMGHLSQSYQSISHFWYFFLKK